MSYCHSTRRRELAVGVALLGCSLAAATRTDAAIVVLNLGASGFNVLGTNAGLASGGYRDVFNFPLSGGNNMDLYRGWVDSNSGNSYTGLDGDSGLQFAILGGDASPRNFGSGATIDGSASFSFSAKRTCFVYNSTVSANFGSGSFMGFRTGSSGSYIFGWLEVTWDGTNWEILSGAYESDLNTAILAGATGGGGAVPLPGAAGLAACGLLGLSRRRRR